MKQQIMSLGLFSVLTFSSVIEGLVYKEGIKVSSSSDTETKLLPSWLLGVACVCVGGWGVLLFI